MMDNDKKISISIVIVNYNGARFIKRCIESILQSNFSDYELTLVDDASEDKSKQVLQEYTDNQQTNLLFLTKNIGPARARNAGVQLTRGELLFFLDIDTYIKEDCLQAIAAKFQQDNKIGAVQCKLMHGNNGKIETVGHFLSFAGFPYEITDESELKNNIIFGARSAALAIRKEIFIHIGGFDTDYFIYGEDTDLSWRVWLAGYKVAYLSEAKVCHFAKSSLSKKTQHHIFYEGAKNNTANLLKNASFTTLLWILPLHVAGWVIISIKLIIQGRFDMAGWIYRGLWWNTENLHRTLVKRKYVQSITDTDNEVQRIIFGPSKMKEIFGKGLKWISRI